MKTEGVASKGGVPKTMSCRKTRVVLTLEQKEEILRALEEGVSGAELASKYRVDMSTISRIESKGEDIKGFIRDLRNRDGPSSAKVMKTAADGKLDEAVFLWYVQKRLQGFPVSVLPLPKDRANQLQRRAG